MNVKRFFGRTNKDALARLRAELGSDAIVLKNRAVDGGVEILAMADSGRGDADLQAARLIDTEQFDRPSAPPADEIAQALPEMTTVSFQQYVKDRLARRSAEASAQADASTANERRAAARPVSEPAARPRARPSAASAPASASTRPVAAPEPMTRSAPARVSALAPAEFQDTIAEALGEARESITEAVQTSVMAELRQMKHFIADQIEALSWFDETRRQPVRKRLLKTLMTAGFSPALARALVSRVPVELDEVRALGWTAKALERNLRCDADGSLFDAGGIFALIGPTGVGKTTSTAKIAANFALKHGTQSMGLITVDAYRIGAQDQLRSFGRMLGVPVHVAHDTASLNDFLQLFAKKKLVLIDTAGIGQRDPRVDELLASLSSKAVRKLLVVNAAAQVETQEEVITAYRGAQAAGMIISKLDEAVRPAGALDCAIRHRMRVVGVADGQRVPEDWSWPDGRALIRRALSVQSSPAFAIDDQMLGMIFTGGRGAGSSTAGSAARRRSDV